MTIQSFVSIIFFMKQRIINRPSAVNSE